MSLPVCPECGGERTRRTAAALVNAITGRDYPEIVPCPACGGSGVDITELVEDVARRIAEVRYGPLTSSEWRRVLGAERRDEYLQAGRAAVLAVLAVLDKEG